MDFRSFSDQPHIEHLLRIGKSILIDREYREKRVETTCSWLWWRHLGRVFYWSQLSIQELNYQYGFLYFCSNYKTYNYGTFIKKSVQSLSFLKLVLFAKIESPQDSPRKFPRPTSKVRPVVQVVAPHIHNEWLPHSLIFTQLS